MRGRVWVPGKGGCVTGLVRRVRVPEVGWGAVWVWCGWERCGGVGRGCGGVGRGYGGVGCGGVG